MQLFFKEKYQRYERETPFDFSTRSSIGCGGKSSVAFYPKTIEEMLSLLQSLEGDGIPYYTLGNLTNVLPMDGSIKSVVVCTKKMRVERQEELFFDAGISSSKLLSLCQDEGKSGVEFLEGIPCTLGGALYMNAGVNGNYIADVVESVTIYREGELLVLPKTECGFSYKRSLFMDGKSVILGAKLGLVCSSKERVVSQRQAYKERRKHLPKGKSMGCVFKNPIGISAGKLIEGAGLKGLRVGGAVVSSEHANFIINDNHATARNVMDLIAIIKSAVFAQYKIRLEEEIRYVT